MVWPEIILSYHYLLANASRSFVLTGSSGLASTASPTEHRQPNPHPEWLADKCWDEVLAASAQLPHCQVTTAEGRDVGDEHI